MTEPHARAIVGLVDASGPAGGSSGGDAWSLIFHLESWHPDTPGSREDPFTPLREPPVRCLLPVPKEALGEHYPLVPAYGAVALEITEGSAESGLVTGARIVQADVPDAALLRRAAKLRQPVFLDHETLGRLEYSRRYDWYETETLWRGRRITLTLDTGTPDADSPAVRQTLAHAVALLADQDAWGPRIDAFAAERLLPLKNETWLGEDEEGEEETPLDAPAFIARMELQSIQLDPDGGFTFWHDDGDLFWGHSIQVSGTLADGPTDADIPG